jgi:hypothetical protein
MTFMTYEDITAIADISLALSFLVALVFGFIQIKQIGRDRRERFTMETLRNFQTLEFAKIEGRLSYHKSPSNFKEFEQLPLARQAEFIRFSQEMESLGILVAEGLIDIDLVDKTLGLFVTTSWQKYKTVFEEIRQKHSDPFLGEYFQWLAAYISDRMKKQPRKPFYEKNRFINDL